MSFPRPVTSKSRGVCRYYNSPRGCFAGNSCKFLHGVPVQEIGQNDQPLLTPYDQAKECRYYQRGFCKRGELCWFKHVDSHHSQANILEEEDQLCSVCFEKPVTFGLLEGCNHIFCIGCIKKWRDPSGKPGDVVESGNTKKCPMCRTSSRFITPSSKFYIGGEKADVIKAYQASMGRVTCRYFQTSQAKNKNKPLCPFGKDCFYKHVNEDGTPFQFQAGVDVSMRRYRAANGMEDNDFLPSFFPFPLDVDSFSLLDAEGVNIAMNHLDFSAPRNGQRRNVERLRRLNVGIQDSEVPATTERLREVGRSLEMLNNAIHEGATLETLNVAVEALRMGLGRLERGQRNGSGGGIFRRHYAENGDIEEDAEEDEVMERLETLADQMLASINVLRAHSNSPPPLEPIDETIAIETRPPRLTPDEEFFGLERDFGGSESSDDSMPDLRSVSNSSDSDCDESDEDAEEIHGINGGTSFHPHDLRFDIAGSLRAEEATARRGGRSSLSILNRGLSPATQRTVAQDGDTGRFSTVVGSEEQRDVNTDIEDDEGSSNEEVAATIAVPPTTLSMPDPPFVTDGRGRVVWTSPGENVRNDESNELIVPPGQRATVASANGEFNGDVRGRVIETSSEGQASEETAVDVRDMDRPRRSLLGRIIDAFF